MGKFDSRRPASSLLMWPTEGRHECLVRNCSISYSTTMNDPPGRCAVSSSFSCYDTCRAVGEATCRAWRAGLKTFKPEALVIGEGMGSSLRQAALLVHWLATHPLTQLRHLWLPTNSATHAALEVAIRALPRGVSRG